MKNACLEAALDELNDAGIRDVSHARGGKHWQIRWGGPNGVTRFYNVPGTPSDYRTVANTRADVRRLLRADGFIVDREPAKPKPLDRMTRLEQRISALELEVVALRKVE
jgi:hypothetical protein